MYKWLVYIIKTLFAAFLLSVIISIATLYYFAKELPDYQALLSYQPSVISRFYASNGSAFAEYAQEKRIYVPTDYIPQHIKKAFIAAEDKNFYSHYGVDFGSIAIAIIRNVKKIAQNKRPIGASTITQQVAKNFLLSKIATQVTLTKKIKEAILAFRIEKAFSKEYILELYLNQVYLGNRSYGVAAAALYYFNKSLEEITIGEAAFLAGLPKAPSRYNINTNIQVAYARRNWVLQRMLDNNFITQEEAMEARKEILDITAPNFSNTVAGEYFAEEVRKELIASLGEKAVYHDGYVVRTTLDTHLQKIAQQALQKGLISYDRRHGWRGPLTKINIENIRQAWPEELEKIKMPLGLEERNWQLAIVLAVEHKYVIIGLQNNRQGIIPLANLIWARRYIDASTRGDYITNSNQVLEMGDVILVEYTKLSSQQSQHIGELYTGTNAYGLRQMPTISGGIVVIDQYTGNVLALQGGFSFSKSKFNRVTQAKRQTGSSFKPFVYLAALELGLNPTSTVYDEPIVIDIGYNLGIWQPKNWDEKFLGKITLRRSFELSRNLPIIRVIHEYSGLNKLTEIASRLNIDNDMPEILSSILGASETSLLNLTTAYAMIANGGIYVKPTFIARIQNRIGKTVLINSNNTIDDKNNLKNIDIIPNLSHNNKRVISSVHAYQLISMLKGNVQRGLGKLLRSNNHEIAIKSGTTNDYKDAWMMGFSPQMTVGVYIGFDQPVSLGEKEYGSHVAGPIIKEFFTQALKNTPRIPFKIPQDIKLVRINPNNGQRALATEKEAIYEALDRETVIDNSRHDKTDSVNNLAY